MRRLIRIAGAIALVSAFSLGAAQGQPPAGSGDFEVLLEPGAASVASGRLIVMAAPFAGGGQSTPQAMDRLLAAQNIIGLSPGSAPGTLTLARRDVRMTPGAAVRLGAGDQHFPTTSAAPSGVYLVQAVLDTNRNFAYTNRADPGDLVSDIVVWHAPDALPALKLVRVSPSLATLFDRPAETRILTGAAADDEANRLAARAHAERVEMKTRAMTAFSPTAAPLKAWVLTPPGYEQGAERYPVVFWNGGFGINFNSAASSAAQVYREMVGGQMPPMIWVFLDHSGPTGTHEFADSANNGPWGKALTEEFIPWLDGKYRTDGAKGRFATGHSSGGWAALWLQVRYPKLFAGSWPTAPDPSDFHDFTNVDIYAANANAYRRPDGSPTILIRGTPQRPAVPLKDYADQEVVLGEAGGQFASFDWVFSPRGADGKPQPLFDRRTGAVDPKVALYWRDNYDIAWRIKRDWKTLQPDLDGKIHLWVGTADTFHLDGSARLLQAALDSLGAKSEFHFIEGADHGTLTRLGGSTPRALERRNAWAMYAQARPNSTLRPPA